MPLYKMKEILKDAQEKVYGVGFFDTINQEMVRACIRAAEDLDSPIIIGTAEGLLTYSQLEWITPIMLQAAKNSKVPVAVHLDHAYSFKTIECALQNGFGSIMFDGSRLTYRQNIENSKEIIETAHAKGVDVECELGCVGGLTDGNNHVDENKYTDPSLARSFVEETGADFLAVSIGTLHGVYDTEPKLDLQRLADIRKKVDVPLVLHGGSGLSDDDFRKTIQGGICKVNVYTDVINVAKNAILSDTGIPYPDMLKKSEDAMTEEISKKLVVFNNSLK